MKRLLLILCVVALSACSSDPATRQEVAIDESAQMRPPEIPLSAFGSFELLPVAMSPEVSANGKKAEIAIELGRKLETRLRPMIQSWESSAPTDIRKRTLVIKPTVAELRVVSGGARFWAGGFAGDSSIDLDIALIEKKTGRLIANQRINRSANALAGAWSIGASDKNLLDYIVDISYQYLADNRKS